MENACEYRTELEQRIMEDSEFSGAMAFTYPKKNRPEKNVGLHVAHQLEYIDVLAQQTQTYTDRKEQLRLIALLHDFGKYAVQRDDNGRIIGPSHSMISHAFAQTVVSDPDVLEVVRVHDKHFRFYLDALRGKYSPERLVKAFSGVPLDLLTAFQYVDSCERDKIPTQWFEHACKDAGLKKEILWERIPIVLSSYHDLVGERRSCETDYGVGWLNNTANMTHYSERIRETS